MSDETKAEHVIPRGVLALATVAATVAHEDVTRYAMHAIEVRREAPSFPAGPVRCMATATNGSMLARVTWAETDAERGGKGEGTALVSRDACLAAAKIAKAHAKGDQSYSRDTVRLNGALHAVAKDGTACAVPTPAVGGHWPPCDEVIPAGDETDATFALDADLLVTLARALNAAAGREGALVVLKVPTTESGMRKGVRVLLASRVGGEGQDPTLTSAIGLLMPVNTSGTVPAKRDA